MVDFGQAQRAKTRKDAYARDQVDPGFDRKRPTRNRRIPANAVNSAEDAYLASVDPETLDLPALLGCLTELEQQVLTLRLGLTNGTTHTQREAALRLGFSRERVAFLEASARNKLTTAALSAVS